MRGGSTGPTGRGSGSAWSSPCHTLPLPAVLVLQMWMSAQTTRAPRTPTPAALALPRLLPTLATHATARPATSGARPTRPARVRGQQPRVVAMAAMLRAVRLPQRPPQPAAPPGPPRPCNRRRRLRGYAVRRGCQLRWQVHGRACTRHWLHLRLQGRLHLGRRRLRGCVLPCAWVVVLSRSRAAEEGPNTWEGWGSVHL